MMKIATALLAATAFCATFTSLPANAANVAIVKGSFYTGDLAKALRDKGNTVDEISSYNVASLTGYNTVIEYGNTFVDQSALSTFVSAGGTLIWTPWAGLNYSVNPNLQVFTNGGGASHSAPNQAVTTLAPDSALLNGVTFPTAGSISVGRLNSIGFATGSTQIAKWSDNTAFVGTKALGAGTVVGINLQAITSDTAYGAINQPWASTLFDNAVNVTGAVPEPASWAMMILGMGVIGYSLRRAKRRSDVKFDAKIERMTAGALA